MNRRLLLAASTIPTLHCQAIRIFSDFTTALEQKAVLTHRFSSSYRHRSCRTCTVIVQAPYGSLFASDDTNGVICRVSWAGGP